MSDISGSDIMEELRAMRKDAQDRGDAIHKRITDLALGMAHLPCSEQAKRLDGIEAMQVKQGELQAKHGEELASLRTFAWRVGAVATAVGTAIGTGGTAAWNWYWGK
jgi:hypothetical protein